MIPFSPWPLVYMFSFKYPHLYNCFEMCGAHSLPIFQPLTSLFQAIPSYLNGNSLSSSNFFISFLHDHHLQHNYAMLFLAELPVPPQVCRECPGDPHAAGALHQHPRSRTRAPEEATQLRTDDQESLRGSPG